MKIKKYLYQKKNELDSYLGLEYSKNIYNTGTAMSGYLNSIYGSTIPINVNQGPNMINAFIGPPIVDPNMFRLVGGKHKKQKGGNIYAINQIDYEADKINRIAARNELSSGLLSKLMVRVQSDLKEAGFELNPKDKKSLELSIAKVKDIELKTFKLYELLKKLSNLLTFFKASTCSESDLNTQRLMPLKRLQSKNLNAINLVENNISKLQKCINSNNQIQLSTCTNVSNQIADLFKNITD